MSWIIYIALGYLSGSILYSYYLPLWLKGLDVTLNTPDGNPGAFNCISKAGWPLGLAALACDVLKGAVPVLLGLYTVLAVVILPVIYREYAGKEVG